MKIFQQIDYDDIEGEFYFTYKGGQDSNPLHSRDSVRYAKSYFRYESFTYKTELIMEAMMACAHKFSKDIA